MELVFRLAEAKDFPAVAGIFKEATRQMCAQGILQWDARYPSARQLRADIKNAHMYLLLGSGEIISAVAIDEEQPREYKDIRWKYENEKTTVLHRLCVNPARQNRGYGRKTVLNAERMIKDMDYTAVRLDAFSQNPSALKLYEGLGYIRSGEVVFRKGRFFLYEKLLTEE